MTTALVRIPIYFDYASTLCYIAWRIVRELEGELGFEALWKGVPIAMRDHRAKPGRVLGDREREKVLMVAAETGIAVAPPKSWIDSSAALQGSEIARDAGVFRKYHEAVFRAAFEQGVDIANADVLDTIAERAGMNRARFRATISSGAMTPRIESHKREADEFSALGYPTFILGEFPLIGIQPIESMRLLIGRFLRQRSQEPQA
ncbi:MAG: DsbA family protein [Candidatus Binatus sp.]|uniref:DsbA family oxidoreductase n=1 Tax=Candidatus Binatus sp. TaxID=2811406 RepID=UPI002716342B|nr:DsbA family protein [Candidatus Binatus sp.]MDO8431295.1 DsbA family protein [Candidatus Binatus sp.]